MILISSSDLFLHSLHTEHFYTYVPLVLWTCSKQTVILPPNLILILHAHLGEWPPHPSIHPSQIPYFFLFLINLIVPFLLANRLKSRFLAYHTESSMIWDCWPLSSLISYHPHSLHTNTHTHWNVLYALLLVPLPMLPFWWNLLLSFAHLKNICFSRFT